MASSRKKRSPTRRQKKSGVSAEKKHGHSIHRPTDYSSSETLRLTFAPLNVAVLYRLGTPSAIEKARELAVWLQSRGFEVFSAPGQKLVAGCHNVNSRNVGLVDWVITLGGDGTYLRAVRMLEGRQTPILGVNMGHLGFLTETHPEGLKRAVLDTLSGKMQFRPRSMLRVEVRRKSKLESSHIALNDMVVERGSVTHLIDIAIASENKPVAELKADALIVATPTGSTAYNLAAGGPILHPEARTVVITPVCPHALTSRPMIFPDDRLLSFRLVRGDATAILTIDGVRVGEISVDHEVVVIRSPLDHYVIRKPDDNYFQLLRDKLKFGQRN